MGDVQLMKIVIYTTVIFCLVYWLEFYPSFLPNVLIKRKDPSDELEDWLKAFNWGTRQLRTDVGIIPQYKFYSGTIEILLDLARKMGGNYQDGILYLREGLQVDRQFEKKIREGILGVWLQMFFMLALTWVFIICALFLVQIRFPWMKLFFILSWQLIGLSVLPLTLSWLRKKYFADIGKLWKMLFVLKSLHKVPLARSEILNVAGIQELSQIKQKSLLGLVQKLSETCQNTLKLGQSYEQDVKYLMEELRFLEKFHFELFEKKLTVLKLILLSVFFLPSYLAFIFILLGDLMHLM